MANRRDFLRTTGLLVVGFSLGDEIFAAQATRGAIAGPPDPKLIDTWLAIHSDNTATLYIGFAELGQGASTALVQIAADELDLDLQQMKSVQLDTNVTPDQGGTVSSASINRGGPQVRAAAAEARLALLELASKRLETPVERLTVSKGIVSVLDAPSRRVLYGELLGDRRFDISITGTAPLKPVFEYELVGTSAARRDIPENVGGQYVYIHHLRVPLLL